MKNFTNYFLPAIAFVTLAGSAAAQDTATLDIDARRDSIAVVESHVAQRQSRLDSLKTEIKALDGRVEKSVEEIVKMVSGIRDSKDSQVRVAMLKADIIDGLKNSVQTYIRHRDSLREQLRRDTTAIPRETLESDLDVFLERIELRVEQVKTITESFTDPQDLPKYVKTNTSSWGRWGSVQGEKISDAWRLDRKESRHTEAAQDQLIDALRASITHLEQRNSLMTEKLRGQNITAAERELYKSDLERNTTLIATRQEQIYSMQSEFDGPSLDDIKPLERNAAHETELFVRDMRVDLRRDFFAIFEKYAELNKERGELEALKENLAARKKWLADYDAQKAK